MYSVYVITRLLYGLETVVLKKKHFLTLETYHRQTLRRLQSLPSRTSRAAIYLLIGIPPIEARLDSAIAALLQSIGRRPGSILQRLAIQQLMTKDATSHSWFAYARSRLSVYGIDAQSLVCDTTPAVLPKQLFKNIGAKP
jgi:hypothetical protein